ncbi:class C beta-lactamase [Bordetella tumulicola]|uniref:class C beta-lactamase n=1 Tax=Bordetella tumulicola TaxID=1649133 RepID=UPI0039EF3F1D
MYSTNRRFLQTLCCVCVVTIANHASAEESTPGLAVEISQATEHVMREYNVPGMAIAVTDHGRQTFYNFGVASKATNQSVTSDTLFEIGSVSKTFTATLATYAQTLGRLSLDDSPASYLPTLRGSNLSKVSLVHLGTHTAGGFPLQVPDAITNSKQLMRYFAAWTPQYEAGSARTYANPSIGLLGMVAAEALGHPYKAIMERQLFPLLGLHDSYIDVPRAKMQDYAQGYDKTDAPVRVTPGVLADEAYGVKATARDLIRFVQLNIESSGGEGNLDKALRDTRVGYYKLGAMTQDLVWEQYDAPVRLDDLLEGNSAKVAYETHPIQAIVPPRAPASAVWVNKTGSTNGFGAYVAFLPAQDKGIVILANKNFPIEARIRLAYRILTR